MIPVFYHPCSLSCLVQRADEVNTVDPKVAYYCRMYAIEQVRALRSPLEA